MGKEAGAVVYDAMHDDETVYDLPTEQSPYYPLFRGVVDQVERRRMSSVLEVGCGSGGLAELLLRSPTVTAYRGFDFSAVGVRKAGERIRRPELFFVGDALDEQSYRTPYGGIVCTEVLEHIAGDLEAIALWRPGVECVCSVPNFDYETHVRHFRREDEVRSRYGDLIDIDTIIRVPKPVRAGLTWREYLRKLRWARDEPKKLIGLLGINTFDFLAGWFLFAGRRRH